MFEIVSCDWGKSKTFIHPLKAHGSDDLVSGVSLVAGDVKISINGAAFANIATLPTILGNWMIITLSATEMQGEYIAFQAVDQSGTKIFKDVGIVFTTTVRAWTQILFSLIESQRGSHTGVHDMIFWDPIGGNDANSGEVYHEAKQTFNYNGGGGVHSLLNNNEHQIVIALPNAAGGPTTVNEYVEIDKAYTFFRGPGRDFLLEATHNESCVLATSAEGIEVSGIRVKTKATGSQDGICAGGDFTALKNIWCDYSRGSGIVIDNASSCRLDDFLVQDSAQGGSGHAVHILGDTSLTERNIVGSGRIFNNGNGGGGADGIRVDGVNCIHTFITGGPKELLIHHNTGYGINEVNGADHTIVVGPTIHVGHNTLGQFNLTGTGSIQENVDQWSKDSTVINSVIAYPGQFTPPFSTRGEEIAYPRRTQNSIPYDLDSDISGLTIKFMAKQNHDDTDAEAAIPLKDITSGVTDAANGLGVAPLTESESDIAEGKYYAEVQSLSGAVVIQRWFFKLVIIHNVIDGA